MSRRARASRPVRTSSRSPRPTRADSPCAAMVASRCSVVMAKPSGSSPSVPSARPTSSRTPRPAISPATVSMPVTRSPSLVTTSPARRPFQALPWSKMWPRPSHWVEALQRHGDDVVRAADAVREALVAALGVGAGVEHRVHRVGAAPPALLRAVHVEGLRQREARRPAGPGPHPPAAWRRRGSSACRGRRRRPSGPSWRRAWPRGDGALGVAAVEAVGERRVTYPTVVQPTRVTGRRDV